jgi:CRISPR-associated protein Cas2
MQHVIAYDIADDGSRERIAQILSGYGRRVQYSVFEVECNAQELQEIIERIEPHVHETSDSIRLYWLCADCLAALHLLGNAASSDEPDTWII